MSHETSHSREHRASQGIPQETAVRQIDLICRSTLTRSCREALNKLSRIVRMTGARAGPIAIRFGLM